MSAAAGIQVTTRTPATPGMKAIARTPAAGKPQQPETSQIILEKFVQITRVTKKCAKEGRKLLSDSFMESENRRLVFEQERKIYFLFKGRYFSTTWDSKVFEKSYRTLAA
jgi:hypothetical protein